MHCTRLYLRTGDRCGARRPSPRPTAVVTWKHPPGVPGGAASGCAPLYPRGTARRRDDSRHEDVFHVIRSTGLSRPQASAQGAPRRPLDRMAGRGPRGMRYTGRSARQAGAPGGAAEEGPGHRYTARGAAARGATRARHPQPWNPEHRQTQMSVLAPAVGAVIAAIIESSVLTHLRQVASGPTSCSPWASPWPWCWDSRAA